MDVTLVTISLLDLRESYTYDAMNNLLSKTDRKQQTINYGVAGPKTRDRHLNSYLKVAS